MVAGKQSFGPNRGHVLRGKPADSSLLENHVLRGHARGEIPVRPTPADLLAGGACCLLENRPRLPAQCHVIRDTSANPTAGFRVLTPAERRVLVYVCAGYSNKEIATALSRAEPTIKHQVSACLRKMGQPSRARLIAALR